MNRLLVWLSQLPYDSPFDRLSMWAAKRVYEKNRPSEEGRFSDTPPREGR